MTIANNNPGLQLPHDIISPEPISWWPLAYGWWFIIALLILITLAFFWWQKRRHASPTKQALKQLRQLLTIQDDREFLSQCAHWIKQQAMQFYGREQTASLHGQSWLTFLDQTGNTTAFSQGAGQQLQQLYQPSHSAQREPLIEVLSAWLLQQGKSRHV